MNLRVIVSLPEVLFSARYVEQQGIGICGLGVQGLSRIVVAMMFASLTKEDLRDMIR